MPDEPIPEGEDRDDDDSPMAELIAAVAVALTAIAIRFRNRQSIALTAEAAEELVRAHVEAHLIGQSEWAAPDAQRAAAVAVDAVYGSGGQVSRLARWEAAITSATTDRRLAAIATMQAGSTWPTYQRGRADGAGTAVGEAGGEVWAVWRRDRIDTSCADCIALDGQRWPASQVPQWPGDGSTKCLSNCRCQLEMIAEALPEAA